VDGECCPIYLFRAWRMQRFINRDGGSVVWFGCAKVNDLFTVNRAV